MNIETESTQNFIEENGIVKHVVNSAIKLDMIPPLYKHQTAAIDLALNNNGILAIFAEPGLGKTRTCLEIFTELRRKDPQLTLFVICPLSLIRSAWGSDIETYTPFTWGEFKRTGPGLKIPDIMLINYESFISKKHYQNIINFAKGYPTMCVLDESSRLKNNKSVTTKLLLEIRNLFKYRLIASGSPCPNSELELWGQIKFLDDKTLPDSFYAFRNTYFQLERGGRVISYTPGTLRRDELRNLLFQGWKYQAKPHYKKQLMEKISPLCQWVKKKDALDLPEQIDEIRTVQLNPEESKLYKDMKTHLVAEFKDKEIAVQSALTKLIKLRQITSGFLYSKDENEDQIICSVSNPSKLRELKATLEELGEQPSIVWVQFHQEINDISKMIEHNLKKSFATLYSKTQDRDKSIDDFKRGKVQYLIAHPKSAAHGLTFTNASTAIFYSCDYSFESHYQAKQRIHRIGQKNSCLYVYLHTENTIDLDIYNVLTKKSTLQESIYAILGKQFTKTSSN